MRAPSVQNARAGIAGCWVVDLIDRALEVHREPERSAAARWKDRRAGLFRPRAAVWSLPAPRRRIRVAGLLP